MNMKKLFYLLFVAVLGMGLAACDKDDPKPRNGGNNYGPGGGGNENENLDVKFTSDNYWCGYYGDALNTGKGTFVIELYKGDIDDYGYLKSKGYAVTLTVNGPLVGDGETLTLPVGTYKTNLNKNADFKIHNEDYDPYISYVELWVDGDQESVTDFISGGTMKITNNKGKYTVECDLDMYYISDNDGKHVSDGNLKATYTGAIEVVDATNDEGGLDLLADQFWCGYYGDYLGLGTGMYMVEINDGTIDDAGYLTSPGTAITLAVNGEMPAEGETVTLPVGTYTTDLEMTDNFKIINEDVGFYLSFVEKLVAGETTSYTDFISKGTMTVTNQGGGQFVIFCDLDMFYEDENGNVVDDGNLKGAYTGQIFVDDYTGGGGGGEEQKLYDTYPVDVDLGEMTECVGSFYKFTKSQLGNYYLSLFNVGVDWEKEEFTGPGTIMTIDLFTDYTEQPDLNQLNATFTIAEDGEYEEWTYQPGKVFLSNGEASWSGTYIDEICELEDEEGKYFGYGRSSMVTGGTIKATSDGTNVTFELDLTTETGNKIVGKYSGKPEVSVPENNAVDAVKARKIKSANDLMRPFSKYERLGRKAVRKSGRNMPRTVNADKRQNRRAKRTIRIQPRTAQSAVRNYTNR